MTNETPIYNLEGLQRKLKKGLFGEQEIGDTDEKFENTLLQKSGRKT